MGAIRLLVVILCLWGASALAAEGPSADPALVRPKRLVHFFDFEERKLGNYERLPMHWYIVGRSALTADPNFNRQPLHRELITKSGYPTFTEVRFDTTYARSGQYSFMLGLNGGNSGAYLEVGTMPAVPGSDYLVSAWVRTDGLERASARLVAYFLDKHGAVIPASRTPSEPLRDAPQWTETSVKLTGDFPNAAWIGLELEVLQPLPSPDNPLGKQQVVLQDVGGGAWFDDIGIWQLPHVEVSSQSPVNIIRAPQKPQLSVDVRDLTGTRLKAAVVVYDHRLQEVARQERGVGAGAPMSWRWVPELPGYGWYLVDLLVQEADTTGGPVARSLGAFLYMPPAGVLYGEDRYRFSLVGEEAESSELILLSQVLDGAKIDAAVISAWARDTTLTTLDERQGLIDDTIRNMLTSGRRITMSLHPVPQELAELEAVDSSNPLAVMRASPEAWLPYLAPIVMRQGQRVRDWQLGESSEGEAFFQGDLPGLLGAIEGRFRALAPQPRLILPWRLDQSRRPELDPSVTLAMDVPATVPPEHLLAHLKEWQSPPSSYWLYLHEPPADQVPHQSRVEDLALRMVAGWRSPTAGLALPRPWTKALERRNALWPDPLLGVFSEVAQRLAGRRMVGELPLPEGIEGLIFDGEPGGMIVAWNRDAEPAEAVLDMYLGERPVAIDIWGNRQPVTSWGGRHRLQLTHSPQFIVGIDPELALLRGSFRVTPSFVTALQKPHEHEVTIRNPWTRTISGNIQFTGPKGWSLQPAKHYFSLTPGDSLRLPVNVTFPFAELAGPKLLTARVEFIADRQYDVELSTPMELGLPDMDFQPTVAIAPGKKPGTYDAHVVCVISNTGGSARSWSVFATHRGQPRQERSVANLTPGSSIVRRFTFTDLTVEDRRHPIRVGIRELNGPAVLNKVLSLDGP